MAVPVERAEIRMYGKNSELLKTKEIFGGTEEVTLQEETAYVIVEEVKTDGGSREACITGRKKNWSIPSITLAGRFLYLCFSIPWDF